MLAIQTRYTGGLPIGRINIRKPRSGIGLYKSAFVSNK